MRGIISRLLALPLAIALAALAACGGSAIVTITASPSTDNFLAYRVNLAAVQLLTSSGKRGPVLLPATMSVDFTKLENLSEVLAAPSLAKGIYSSALVTLDYRAAQIVYDDGSLEGVTLAPVTTDGKALGLVSITVSLDPNAPMQSVAKQTQRLALDFNLAASNLVNLSNQTVTVTPHFAASTLAIDAKPVRVRGALLGATSRAFATRLTPFGGTAAGLGQLAIVPGDATTYEVNGLVSIGASGQTQLAALPASTLTVAFGTLNSSDTTAAATSTTIATTSAASTVSFVASQVLVDSSVAGIAFDRLSGVVSARSGNALGIENATLIQRDGTNTFIPGTTIVNVGSNTFITFLGQGVAEVLSPQLISVGSVIDAFGSATTTTAGGIVVDASVGRVRLDLSSASGLVTVQENVALTLNLSTLGGRAVSGMDFADSGGAADRYRAITGSLDLTNAIVGAPILLNGFPDAFGTVGQSFIASTLLDATTIQAELVVDWSGGTAAPFKSFDSSSIDLDPGNTSIGPRHQIQIGAQIINVVGLSSDPLITPAASGNVVFSIGHSGSGTVETFNTYSAFIGQLQTELSGSTLATGIVALGQYTPATFAFSATSISLTLND
jgi:hypothetical protein